MLQNAYFLAKIGADTAENEQHFAEICQKLATTLRATRHGPVELNGVVPRTGARPLPVTSEAVDGARGVQGYFSDLT